MRYRVRWVFFLVTHVTPTLYRVPSCLLVFGPNLHFSCRTTLCWYYKFNYRHKARSDQQLHNVFPQFIPSRCQLWNHVIEFTATAGLMGISKYPVIRHEFWADAVRFSSPLLSVARGAHFHTRTIWPWPTYHEIETTLQSKRRCYVFLKRWRPSRRLSCDAWWFAALLLFSPFMFCGLCGGAYTSAFLPYRWDLCTLVAIFFWRVSWQFSMAYCVVWPLPLCFPSYFSLGSMRKKSIGLGRSYPPLVSLTATSDKVMFAQMWMTNASSQ